MPILYCLYFIAYTLWGILGLFWELLHTVPPLATLSYRVIWSLVTILFVITIQKDWHNMLLTVINLIKNKRIYYIAMSSLFISLNWFIYIYMVTHHQATEASLGYYIMPIMNVVVAILFLHEKLTKYSTLALIFVIIGVTVLTINTGSIPITTIIMAASFCLYGLIKKQVPLPSTMSLALETALILKKWTIFIQSVK
ncbi:EamA family transporter RarD [Leuconostoc palmae]|uniref:EamA family transporter RarD n=1 Tax=Leuconostoc palmae TaxID=501487 RepID=UPI0027E46DAC|nr:EamA family transporter RarD [Leuconostoc palmae]